MQELSDKVRRFQQIKAREKAMAIARAAVNAEKAKIQQFNPSLSQSQVDELYRQTHGVKNIVVGKRVVSIQKV